MTPAQRLAAWQVFDNRNPRVWEWFCHFTQELLDAGDTRGSSTSILGRVRYESAIRHTVGDPTA